MSQHIPVLLQEVLEGLNIRKGDTVVDATLGGGGYTRAFCKAVGPSGIVVGIDQDIEAIRQAQKEFSDTKCTTHFVEGNFRDIKEILTRLDIQHVQAIAFDLGLSSEQLEDSGRGFTFQKNEPLEMTFKKNPSESDMTAEYIVNNWDEEALSNVFYGYGEERAARKIARAIVEAREKEKIETTGQLKEVIELVMKKRSKIHPATKVFQALRIAVNDELGALEEGLVQAFSVLTPNKRVAVVSFHSLEDRIVKHFFKQLAREKREQS